MSNYERTCRLLKLKTSISTDEACRFLEFCGQHFCVDFGTDNAIDKAIAILDAEWFPEESSSVGDTQ